jgi:hypothetical protein
MVSMNKARWGHRTLDLNQRKIIIESVLGFWISSATYTVNLYQFTFLLNGSSVVLTLAVPIRCPHSSISYSFSDKSCSSWSSPNRMCSALSLFNIWDIYFKGTIPVCIFCFLLVKFVALSGSQQWREEHLVLGECLVFHTPHSYGKWRNPSVFTW